MSELEQMEAMEMEDAAVSEEKDGNLGLVLGLGALGGLAIGAAANGIIKGVRKLKAKKAEKADKPKKERKPFWKKKAKEETKVEEPANNEAEEA